MDTMIAAEIHIKSQTSRSIGGNSRRTPSFTRSQLRMDSRRSNKGRVKRHDKTIMRSNDVPQKMQLLRPKEGASDSKTAATVESSQSGRSELCHMSHNKNSPADSSPYEKVIKNNDDNELIVDYNENVMTSFCCPGLSHSRNNNSLQDKSNLNKNNDTDVNKNQEENGEEDGGFAQKIEEAFMYLIGRAPPVRMIYCRDQNSVQNSEVSTPQVLKDMEQIYIKEQQQLHEQQQNESEEDDERFNVQLQIQKSFDESTALSAALSTTLSATKSFRSYRLSRTFSRSFARSTSATAHTSVGENSRSHALPTDLESLRSKESVMDLSLHGSPSAGIIEIKNLVKSKKKKTVLFRSRNKKGSDRVLSKAKLAEC
mmetsp:Transcript_16561/g.32964  ORF Transcript_16561/g.32964 Transcript_16561/m.32964 type:complete len:370 (+) Transcript_16561:91-1200(+)